MFRALVILRYDIDKKDIAGGCMVVQGTRALNFVIYHQLRRMP